MTSAAEHEDGEDLERPADHTDDNQLVSQPEDNGVTVDVTAAVTQDDDPPIPHRPFRVVCHSCDYVVAGCKDQLHGIEVASGHLQEKHQLEDAVLNQAIHVPGDRRIFDRTVNVNGVDHRSGTGTATFDLS